jgi:hypothetical protein
LDIDPCEIITETAFESVLAVMRFVAAVVGGHGFFRWESKR